MSGVSRPHDANEGVHYRFHLKDGSSVEGKLKDKNFPREHLDEDDKIIRAHLAGRDPRKAPRGSIWLCSTAGEFGGEFLIAEEDLYAVELKKGWFS